ncbi:hypothetical protein [Fundidesulfovibrio terrae]|uniref:hypothetical protein n=1 Tax=Fundidesulfovibrio terrae TaxID=2922866 RepID=UPI001FAEAC86|nr:hypothetical protein [Fundidesulfovibrio terrae]
MPYPTTAGPAGNCASSPLRAALAQLAMRPGMLEHLEGIDVDGDGVPDVPLGPPPMNPMGRMQWQNAMAHRQQMMQAAQARRAQRADVNNRVMLATLEAHDPIFRQVHRKIGEYVTTLPSKLQRSMVRSLTETPGAYLELYQEMRELLLHMSGAAGSGSRSGNTSASRDSRVAMRQAVSGRMSPPVLENAGVMDDRLPGASRAAELAALKARCKAGKAREGDLLRYIELSMPETWDS